MSTTDIDNLTKLDDAISKNLDILIDDEDERSDMYGTVLERTEKLSKIRKSITPEPETVPEPIVDKDRVRFKDLLPVIGSLGGIAIIVVFEAFGHTLTSKATAFVSKSK